MTPDFLTREGKPSSRPQPVHPLARTGHYTQRRKSLLSSNPLLEPTQRVAHSRSLSRSVLGMKACPLCCMSGTATRKPGERLQPEEKGRQGRSRLSCGPQEGPPRRC